MIDLAFLFKMYDRGIAVVVSDTEFLTPAHTIDLFHKCLIRNIIKIKAAYMVFTVYGMWIRVSNSFHSVSYSQHIKIIYLMLDFMSEIHIITSFQLFVSLL